jgi:hypothetical protein
MGRRTSSPPQFGQMPCRTFSAQSRHQVHSYVQMSTSGDAGSRSWSQHSQFGRSSSTWPVSAGSGAWSNCRSRCRPPSRRADPANSRDHRTRFVHCRGTEAFRGEEHHRDASLTTKADHNSIRHGTIPADPPVAAAPGERRYPTVWAYFAGRGSSGSSSTVPGVQSPRDWRRVRRAVPGCRVSWDGSRDGQASAGVFISAVTDVGHVLLGLRREIWLAMPDYGCEAGTQQVSRWDARGGGSLPRLWPSPCSRPTS